MSNQIYTNAKEIVISGRYIVDDIVQLNKVSDAAERQYDAAGNLKTCWKKDDEAKFKAKPNKVAAFYDKNFSGQHVKAALTRSRTLQILVVLKSVTGHLN